MKFILRLKETDLLVKQAPTLDNRKSDITLVKEQNRMRQQHYPAKEDILWLL